MPPLLLNYLCKFHIYNKINVKIQGAGPLCRVADCTEKMALETFLYRKVIIFVTDAAASFFRNYCSQFGKSAKDQKNKTEYRTCCTTYIHTCSQVRFCWALVRRLVSKEWTRFDLKYTAWDDGNVRGVGSYVCKGEGHIVEGGLSVPPFFITERYLTDLISLYKGSFSGTGESYYKCGCRKIVHYPVSFLMLKNE